MNIVDDAASKAMMLDPLRRLLGPKPARSVNAAAILAILCFAVILSQPATQGAMDLVCCHAYARDVPTMPIIIGAVSIILPIETAIRAVRRCRQTACVFPGDLPALVRTDTAGIGAAYRSSDLKRH